MSGQRSPFFNQGVHGFDPPNTGAPVDFVFDEIQVNGKGTITLATPISSTTRTFFCYIFATGTGVVSLPFRIEFWRAGSLVGGLPLTYVLSNPGPISTPTFATTIQVGPSASTSVSQGNILLSLAGPIGVEPTQVFVPGYVIPKLSIDEVRIPKISVPITISAFRVWLGVLSTL